MTLYYHNFVSISSLLICIFWVILFLISCIVRTYCMPQFLHKEGHMTANCKGPIDHYRKFLLLMILCICWISENYIFCTCNMTFCPDNSSFEYHKLAVTVYVMMLGLIQLSCSQIITNNRMFCLLFYYILTFFMGTIFAWIVKIANSALRCANSQRQIQILQVRGGSSTWNKVTKVKGGRVDPSSSQQHEECINHCQY